MLCMKKGWCGNLSSSLKFQQSQVRKSPIHKQENYPHFAFSNPFDLPAYRSSVFSLIVDYEATFFLTSSNAVPRRMNDPDLEISCRSRRPKVPLSQILRNVVKNYYDGPLIIWVWCLPTPRDVETSSLCLMVIMYQSLFTRWSDLRPCRIPILHRCSLLNRFFSPTLFYFHLSWVIVKRSYFFVPSGVIPSWLR